jgi:hypothetical protein
MNAHGVNVEDRKSPPSAVAAQNGGRGLVPPVNVVPALKSAKQLFKQLIDLETA